MSIPRIQGEEAEHRIKRLFMARSGLPYPQGAGKMFAEWSYSDPSSVYAWMNGRRPLMGPALRVLELYERDTDDDDLAAAERRLEAYEQERKDGDG